mmetsp:Transcript_2298/g.3773  ORF Transcript_2298/g.3773 Transcript_2298/m.3773 type:complete len:238 (+) Transcript_2298:103-816(+)
MTISVNKLMNYVAIVLDLIHCQDWAALEKVATEKKLFKVISEHIQKSDEFNGMTLLHAVVKSNPPLDILDAMIDAHGDALKGQDCVGRTPLHVACGTGADGLIIKRLVKAYPQACDMQDEDGKLPLHLACDTKCVIFEGDQTPRAPLTLDVVKVLLSGSMQSVLAVDGDEMNPIEYAIVSALDIEIVKRLRKARMSIRRKEASLRRKEAKTNKEAPTSNRQGDKSLPVLRRNVLAYC